MRYLLFFFLLSFTACGTYEAAKYSDEESEMARTVSQDFEEDNSPPSERLMIYDAYLRIKVKSADGIGEQVENLGKSYGGYVLESGLDRVRIRVPADSLDAAVSAIGKMGKVEQQSVNGRDITEEHSDLNLRLENAKAARQRYLELLDKAQTVTEILPIEKELERLRFDIENLQGQINRLDELVAFSTITVSIDEKVKPGPLGWVFVGLWKGVSWLFVRGS